MIHGVEASATLLPPAQIWNHTVPGFQTYLRV